jgi:pimeloyl-ACP methyl ester carboxylesterase
MSRYLLVHGSWHGGWAWDSVSAILSEAGHDVVAPDLPGRGDDPRDPAEITLADHVDHIAETLGASSSPTILVGHSFGGFVISHVAERMPQSIELLVYVAAFLLRSGQTVLEEAASVPPTIPYLDVDESAGLVHVRRDVARAVFYADCSAADAAWAIARLVPEALAPRRTPASLSDPGFGSCARAYVETVQDRALSIALQREMQEALPCEEVVSLTSGHSPFLSMPSELAEVLLRLGGS